MQHTLASVPLEVLLDLQIECTVERLMREMGLEGAIRGRRYKKTTMVDEGLREAAGSRSARLQGRPSQPALG